MSFKYWTASPALSADAQAAPIALERLRRAPVQLAARVIAWISIDALSWLSPHGHPEKRRVGLDTPLVVLAAGAAAFAFDLITTLLAAPK